MPTVHILHGIHTSEPDGGGMGRFKKYYEKAGFAKVVVHYYGYIYAVTARWKNPKIVEKILPQIRPDDIVVGHSNGGTLIWMLAERGAPISGATLINPALDANKALAPQVRWVNVYFNEGDFVVWWSKILFWQGHPYGEQGRVGYTGSPDPRYSQFDGKEPPVLYGHSDILHPEKMAIWGPKVAEHDWLKHINHSKK